MLVGAFNYLICNYFTSAVTAVTAVTARKTTKSPDGDAAAAVMQADAMSYLCSFLIASLVFK